MPSPSGRASAGIEAAPEADWAAFTRQWLDAFAPLTDVMNQFAQGTATAMGDLSQRVNAAAAAAMKEAQEEVAAQAVLPILPYPSALTERQERKRQRRDTHFAPDRRDRYLPGTRHANRGQG